MFFANQKHYIFPKKYKKLGLIIMLKLHVHKTEKTGKSLQSFQSLNQPIYYLSYTSSDVIVIYNFPKNKVENAIGFC
jgi:superfamily II helicase